MIVQWTSRRRRYRFFCCPVLHINSKETDDVAILLNLTELLVVIVIFLLPQPSAAFGV